MKVVDDKKTPWTLAITCKDCASTLEIVAADVYTESLGSFDEFETYWCVTCGACGQRIELKELPAWVKGQAMTKRKAT